MKFVEMNSDREKAPLMKDLHNLGLKHGVTMVVVAVPINATHPVVHQQGILIDHKEHTSIADVYESWLRAGIYLIQATNALEPALITERVAADAEEMP